MLIQLDAINWIKGSASGNGKTIASTGGAFVSSLAGLLKTVRITNVSFLNNLNGDGAGINATGTVTLTNILANHNSVNGVNYIGGPPIYLLGSYNQFNNNGGVGLYINNMNTVSLVNLEAQNNTYAGVYLFSVRNVSISATTSGWVNQVNNNAISYGVYIYSYGTVKINKVKTNGNGGTGIYIENDQDPLPKYVTLTNIESSNNLVAGSKGVYIDTKGLVTLSNIVAFNNASIGMDVKNNGDAITPQGVTVIKGTFDSNGATGLNIVSYGKITLSYLNASYNAGAGVYASNSGSIFKSAIVVSGINKLLHNTAGSGLEIIK